MKTLYIVIPCYNEELVIEHSYKIIKNQTADSYSQQYDAQKSKNNGFFHVILPPAP